MLNYFVNIYGCVSTTVFCKIKAKFLNSTIIYIHVPYLGGQCICPSTHLGCCCAFSILPVLSLDGLLPLRRPSPSSRSILLALAWHGGGAGSVTSSSHALFPLEAAVGCLRIWSETHDLRLAASCKHRWLWNNERWGLLSVWKIDGLLLLLL